MATKNKILYFTKRYSWAFLPLLLFLYVGQSQSFSSFSSLEQFQVVDHVTKIGSFSGHHKSDPHQGDLPINEKEKEEDEELKESSKEKNNQTAFFYAKAQNRGLREIKDVSRRYILHANNKKAFIPLFILHHSWKYDLLT
ncbi:hypothetical protein [Flexithrix dorotheae]|uniref:hypothetical protein n=1 Tax=Flexithrix dorotheae TaxID=70993 RepID=UPI000374E727|nr:hypothetical protein [Flexithrix dorotheae]